MWKEAERKAGELEEKLREEKQKRQKLEAQLAKYHEKIFKPNKETDDESLTDEDVAAEPSEKGKTRKKPGAKLGHPGTTRKKPDTIDEEIEVSLEQCPNCGGTDLRKLKKTRDHTQEDIVLLAPRATRFVKQLYYCPGCKGEVCGTGENEIPNAYIGPTARALAAALRYESRVPYRQVESLFREVFGLRLTPGALVGFDHKLTARGQPWYEFLKNHVKSAPHIHADETGWRVDGINHYLWIFNNSRLALYHINRHRSSDIPKDILGENYDGILITDCYCGYNPINAREKQKSLSHLLRDNHALAATYPDDAQTQRFTATFKEYMKYALQLQKTFREKKITRLQLNHAADFLKERFWDFVEQPLENQDVDTFRKRLITHKKAIFTFLTHTSIDATNNRAERGLRPSVIMRKVTFGNRSPTGSTNHETLMSLIQTAKLNGTRPLTLLSNLANGCDDERFKELLIDLDPSPT
ncbi:MAG: IS66 family transposase [Candidatus Omnitrophica bacterium]|nr:IS66 family transposase [Candidatus Omnitrophota bacterium]